MAGDHARISPPPMPPGVNTGRPCPKYWDGSIKRLAPTWRIRRELALRYGGVPGETVEARCQYCPTVGLISWPRLASGKVGSWVGFTNLTMDHVVPYSLGGANHTADNFVLACVPCNSSKWNRDLDGWMATR